MSPFEHVTQALTSANRKVGAILKVVGAALLVLVLLVYLVLANENWNFLRGPIGRFASAQTGRSVRIEGDLRAHLLSFTPEVDIGGLEIGKPAWAGQGDTIQVGRARVKARLWPLFLLRLELPLVELQSMKLDLLRDASGRESWALNPSSQPKPFKLPPINQFLIENGALHLEDQTRHLTFDGHVEASEKPVSSGGVGFALNGQGKLNTEAFGLTASGGPLIAVRRDKPYPFRMDVADGPTHITADGSITRPFALDRIDGTLALSGPNLARLYDLTGMTFPHTPAYKLSAHFERNGARYALTGLNGVVGQSDLEGSLTVDRVSGRHTLTGDLTSQRLNFPDLLALLGGPPTRAPAAPAAKAPAQITLPISAKPAPKSAAVTPGGPVLPDAPIPAERLRTMDAQVSYEAKSIKAGVFAMQRATLKVKLDQGVLTIDPLALDLSQGRLFGSVRIDASGPHVTTTVDMRAADIALQQIVHQTGAQPAVQGLLQARARLSGQGDSVHKAAAAANGEVVVVIPHGEMRQAFAELLGINVGRGLFLLLSKDPRETALRCGVAQFDVRNGVMNAQQFVLDTGVVTATGSGDIDLGKEQIALQIKGKTKHPELLRVWTPILVGGTFSKPTLGLNAGAVAAQGGLALGLGALLSPLTVVLPFVAPGLSKNADCEGLVADAKSAGAPVKVNQTTPNTPGKTAPITAPQH